MSGQAPYTITICKGSALIPEMKTLLRAWRPGERPLDFASRAVRDDLLAKTTARRAADLVRRVFARRFLLPSDAPARHLKSLLGAPSRGRTVEDLLLLYSARADALLADAITRVYWPAAERGQIPFGRPDILNFIHEVEARGRIPEPWSEPVKVKVTRGVLRALADFGLLAEPRKSTYEIRVYHPADQALAYLAHELHFLGLSDAAMVDHESWQLFGLRQADVVNALDRLAGDRWWLVQAAGSVVRITWNFQSMEEVVDAIAR